MGDCTRPFWFLLWLRLRRPGAMTSQTVIGEKNVGDDHDALLRPLVQSAEHKNLSSRTL